MDANRNSITTSGGGAALSPPRKETNITFGTILLIAFGVLLVGVLLIAALIGAGVASFNRNTVPAGELRIDTNAVPLGEARSVEAVFKMGVGDLTVRGGANDLMNAEFTYNVESWKPQVSYTEQAPNNTGKLLVEQPNGKMVNSGNAKYEWDVRLNNNVPTDLKINMGVGDSDIELADMNLTRVEIIGGVGSLNIDLTGLRPDDLEVRAINSVGSMTVLLPKDVGIKVTAVKGVGNINARDLNMGQKSSDGTTYTNDLYGKSDRTLNLYVEVATGDITLK